MRHRIYALLSIIVVCFLLLGSMHKLRASDSRGDRQFTFTSNGRDGSATLPSDSNAAKVKEQARNNEAARERSSDVARGEALTPPGQQAGQAGSSPGREVRTRADEEERDAIRDQSGMDELKRGRSAGQSSNIPGTTSTSPNGTSNLFGTGGVPIFPEDWAHR